MAGTHQHTVRSADGVRLHVVEAGDPAGPPIVFLHGFAQASGCWAAQFAGRLAAGFRLVAPDLRGHGRSDKPAQGYDDPRSWAGDLAAIVEQLRLSRPVLVGWSYGGLMICDYVRERGEADVAAYCFVSAITSLNTEPALRLVGPEFRQLIPAMLGSDPGARERADRDFCRLCTAAPRSDVECGQAERDLRACPRPVRQALFRRTADNAALVGGLTRPVLIAHGDHDRVVLPDASAELARALPRATLSRYPGVGHEPFAEQPARFDAELAGFAGGRAQDCPVAGAS
jgi:pimeloyl-ACP methyl ester carboxylesterase